jgi:hypothetical protein
VQQLRWLVPVLILSLMIVLVVSPSAFADGSVAMVEFGQQVTPPPNSTPPPTPTPVRPPPTMPPAQVPTQLPRALPAAGDLSPIGPLAALAGITLTAVGLGVRRRFRQG